MLADVFPSLLSEAEFMILIARMNEVPNTIGGLSYSILKAIKGAVQAGVDVATLRDGLTKAVWEARLETSRIYQAHSRYDHFMDALLAATDETVPDVGDDAVAWAWSLAIALHFGGRRNSTISRDETKRLLERLNERSDLREAFFWACVQMSDTLEGREDDRERFFTATSPLNSVFRLSLADSSWLVPAMSPSADADKRGVAYHAFVYFMNPAGYGEFATEIAGLVADRADLAQHFELVCNPPPRERADWQIEQEERQRNANAEERDRVQGWLDWRAAVLADNDFLLSEDQRRSTICDVYDVMKMSNPMGGSRGGWNSDLIVKAFSAEFLTRLRLVPSF